MNPDYFTKKQTMSLLVVVLLVSFGYQYFSTLDSTAVPQGTLVTQQTDSTPKQPQYPNAELPIGGEVVVVEQDLILVRSGVMTYQVTIDSATKIVERVLKSASEVDRLIGAFQVTLEKNPTQTISYPIIHNSEKPLTLASLKVGDSVMVFSSEASAYTKESFTASVVARMIESKP